MSRSNKVADIKPASMTAPEINKDDIKIFMHVLFSGCYGFIPFRSFTESKTGNPPNNIWSECDDGYIEAAYDYANICRKRHMSCFVIPGTVAEKGKAGSADIVDMQTLLVDIDTGDTEEKLNILSSALGTPTMIVESGGVTDEGKNKLHIYWQLLENLSGSKLSKLLTLRHDVALLVGGDVHFKSAHQPIRVAGSVYYKGAQPKLVKIRSYSREEYYLEELIEGLEKLPRDYHGRIIDKSASGKKDDSFGFSAPISKVITSKVHAGGKGNSTRFSNLQRIVGFWLRRYHSGQVTKEQAIEEIHSYNQANVIPAWDDERLMQLVSDLWKKHLEENGDVEGSDAVSCNNKNEIKAIDLSNWQGSPPKREWLIDEWLPRGYVTALYGDGGVGKSLLAQQLMTGLATGNMFLGTRRKACRVYALMCEDDSNEIWRRQTAINEHYAISMKDIARIRFVSRVGIDNLLMTFANDDVGKLTEFFQLLLNDISEYKPDLVVLDTAADLFGGNENNRPQVRQFIQTACGQIARVTKAALLLCAHPSESGIAKGTGSGGSTAWNNTVRSRWYLKRPENGELTANHRILTRVKSNYSKTGSEAYFKWDNGVFVESEFNTPTERIAFKKQGYLFDKERDRRVNIILQILHSEALKGKFYLMKQFAEKFRNTHDLGNVRSIQNDCSAASTIGLIKFFDNPKDYGLKLDTPNSAFGFMCIENMKMYEGINVDKDTGEITEKYKRILPTHYKKDGDGKIEEMLNPEIWDVEIEKNKEENLVKNDHEIKVKN